MSKRTLRILGNAMEAVNTQRALESALDERGWNISLPKWIKKRNELKRRIRRDFAALTDAEITWIKHPNSIYHGSFPKILKELKLKPQWMP